MSYLKDENAMLHGVLRDAGISLWRCSEADCYAVYWSMVETSRCGDVNCDSMTECNKCKKSYCGKHWKGNEDEVCFSCLKN